MGDSGMGEDSVIGRADMTSSASMKSAIIPASSKTLSSSLSESDSSVATDSSLVLDVEVALLVVYSLDSASSSESSIKASGPSSAASFFIEALDCTEILDPLDFVIAVPYTITGSVSSGACSAARSIDLTFLPNFMVLKEVVNFMALFDARAALCF